MVVGGGFNLKYFLGERNMSKSWDIGRDVYTYRFNMENIGGIGLLLLFPVIVVLWLISKTEKSAYAPESVRYADIEKRCDELRRRCRP